MRILVTGAHGRLGSAAAHELAARGHAVTGVDLDTMDITRPESVARTFESARPELVIHCAALTAVDYCAEHPDEAVAVNGFGTQTVALACQQHDAALAYISTNEVFPGASGAPYQEYDPPAPINPYGYSKWVGEQAVHELVPRHFVVRTSWLFAHGGRNFLHAVLERARQGQPLRVVVDEVSTPTYNDDLAVALADLVATGRYGIYHLVNEGRTSRLGLARCALDAVGLAHVPIEPISLAQYPRTSTPPRYAVLRNVAAARLGIVLRPWQDAVRAFLAAEGLLAADG